MFLRKQLLVPNRDVVGKRATNLGILLLALATVQTASAETLVSFEQFTDGQILSNQLVGLRFTSAEVLTAGISLNEFEFPPHSGSNVASDNGGPITITFDSPITSFSGYFTYAEPLTLDGFDPANNLLAAVTSHYSSNLALSGNPGSSPNELLSISSAVGITEVTIAGDLLGGSFVMDDITFQSAVPEPAPWLLLVLGMASVLAVRGKSKR